MTKLKLSILSAALGLTILGTTHDSPADAGEAGTTDHRRCRRIRGHLVETQSAVGCIAPATTCFFGEVRGHGLDGTTYFAADGGGGAPPTSPNFRSYSGEFEYRTRRGTLTMRETGVLDVVGGDPQGRAVTAYQRVTGGTGDYAGATGYVFVSGFINGPSIDTEIMGEVCRP